MVVKPRWVWATSAPARTPGRGADSPGESHIWRRAEAPKPAPMASGSGDAPTGEIGRHVAVETRDVLAQEPDELGAELLRHEQASDVIR